MQFDYRTGTSGTVTIPAGATVLAFSAYSILGGTLTITPDNGAGGAGAEGDDIPLVAGVPWGRDYRSDKHSWPMLRGGTVLAFTGTDTYYVELALS